MSSLLPSSPPPIPVNPPPRSSPPAGLVASPPPPSNPSMASPPPEPTPSPPPSSTPPPQPSSPPPTSPPPPVDPPAKSPPPPVDPPAKSPPPPSPSDPRISPPPPPTNQPPPPSNIPTVNPPPPPHMPSNSPPPPTKLPYPPAEPPKSSLPPPPPPLPKPPENPPPPPLPIPTPPQNSPPPPNSGTTPVHPESPPSSNSSPLTPPPPPPHAILTPPPPPPFFFSPPSTPSLSIIPSGSPSTNSSSDSAPHSSQSSGDGGLGTGATVAIGLVIGTLFFGILGTVAFCLRKRKKALRQSGGYIIPTTSSSFRDADSVLLKLQIAAAKSGSRSGTGIVNSHHEPGAFGNSRSCFAYDELVKATNGFSPLNLLGEGGFGSVYKGILADGRDVAVKQLKIGGGQGDREFRSEVEIISRVHHRHLVSLVGYCIIEDRRLLVYDYVPNNNLYFHLHGEGRPVLDWAMRVKIALGAARGIAYLHEDCHPRIIHRDIKSSNILLDNNFEARVSDFGLAKLALDAYTHITTRVMGTFGYMAPEYASSGKLTERSDVYSFGVVLLELITGRKPVDSSLPGEGSLVEWARPLLSQALETQEFERLADPRFERQYVDSEMYRMIEATAACIRHSSLKRPKMGQVVRALDIMATTDLTNGMRVGESEMFDPAQQSADMRLFQRLAFGFGSQSFSTGSLGQDSWNSEGDQVNR